MTLEDARALLAGSAGPASGLTWHQDYPMDETVGAVDMLVAAHQATGWAGQRPPAWWLHQIVLSGMVVGDVGFHGPPDEHGGVEIGYSVVGPRRGRGIATRACRLILELAWRDGATAVRAEVASGNQASEQVLLRSGFRGSGCGRFSVARPPAGAVR